MLPRVLMKYKAKLNLHCNINTNGLKTPAEKSVTIDYYLSGTPVKSVLSRLSSSQYSIDPSNSSQLFSISLPSSSYRGSTVNVINICKLTGSSQFETCRP